jgi:hypothetical protein
MTNKTSITKEQGVITSDSFPSLKQSLRIAALDRHLGLRGFIFPVTDMEHYLEYDFYHFQSGTYIKFFESLDSKSLARYKKAATKQKRVLIIDATECGDCKAQHADIISPEILRAVEMLNPLLYCDDLLWRFVKDKDAVGHWEPIAPVERSRCITALSSLTQ